MSGDKFKLPTIPALHVPQFVPVSQPEQRPAAASKPIQTTTNTRSHGTGSADSGDDGAAAARSLVSNFPKLCPSCSASLVQYLQPLQLYVNQLVTIASGMAAGCEHVQIISKIQELPQILKLSEVPGGRTRVQDQGTSGTSSAVPQHKQQPHEQEKQQQHHNRSKGAPERTSNHKHVSHSNDHRQHDHSRSAATSGAGQQKNSPDAGRSAGHEAPRSTDRQPENHQRDQSGWQQTGQKGGRDPVQPVFDSEHAKHGHKAEGQTRDPPFVDSSPAVHHHQEIGSTGGRDKDDRGSVQAQLVNVTQSETSTGESDSDERPFAFVTIVYDNLSAINAIILCNSGSLSCTKQVRFNDKMVQIPFVVVVAGHVDPVLKDHLANVFDEVFFEHRDARLSMLMDESFGVSQVKMQLWKRLAVFEKCFFIESTSLVVGNIDDVFIHFSELSACVDWMFPDSFACSVFVFEPRIQTYDQLMKHATDIVQNNDDPEVPPADDMTILNQFFASKWVKMSFIYNYSQNTAVYTQQPAFAKFGGSIRIVNFDFTPISGPGAFTGRSYGDPAATDGQSTSPSSQPWHVPFDLNRSTQVGEVSTHHQVNNYVRFYLNIFLKRVWPLIRSQLTPLLVARNKHDWSIYELVALLKNPGNDSDESMPYSPIILRRRDPSFQYDAAKDPATTASPVPESGEERLERVDEEGEDEDQQVPEAENLEQSDDNNDSKSETSANTGAAAAAAKPVLVPDLRGDRRVWESGHPDWIGAHGSDKLIDRLKDKFK